MLLSVSKWRRILRGKTETKSAPKTIFSGNGNGLKNVIVLTTREQKNVHTAYVKQDRVCVCALSGYLKRFKRLTITTSDSRKRYDILICNASFVRNCCLFGPLLYINLFYVLRIAIIEMEAIINQGCIFALGDQKILSRNRTNVFRDLLCCKYLAQFCD